MAAETVTVLFTDLVGSTELLSRVGEAVADELRREHFALLRTAIAEHGGREVKNLGDGLMVAFDGANAALECAVAMQQAVTARPLDTEPLAIRVGVSAGEAEVEAGDYFGLPVVEAARLCARADGGDILVSELVRMLAKSRGNVELESVGALELKGLDDALETFRVVWAPIEAPDERPPLPARLASSLSPNFIGRSDERERLGDAWKAVVAGDRRVMLLAGEPGIGKTTLAAQFASEAYDDGAIVVYGRSDEDLGVPYQPWIESLTQLVAHGPEPVLAAHVADRGGHLARLVPELARRLSVEVPPASEGDAERFVLYGCVADLLERVSQVQPVLLVLDDLHWADRATVQLLRHVATADTSIRMGVLGTFRDSEITADHPLTELLAALHRESGGERIALRGFDDDDLLHLLERVAGHDMNEAGVALRDAVLAETAGNPFFVGEVLRHLSESGAIYQDDTGRWVSDTDLRAVGLPVSVREVVGRRVNALGTDTQRVLALAAVIGRDFDVPLLAGVADLDDDALIDLCDAAVAAAILQTTDDPDRYTFAHALIEHTLYDGLSPARKARAHRAVAEQLETTSATDDRRAGELAYHWSQAVQPTDTAKVVHYAKAAGARALDQLAPDDAMRWYAQALEMLDRTPEKDRRERIEVLIGLGDAELRCGVAHHRERLLEAARLADEIDAVDLLVRATLTNARGWGSSTGETDLERITMLRRALDRLPAGDDATRAGLLGVLATELPWGDERLAVGKEAVNAARRSGDTRALWRALYSAEVASRGPSMLQQRKEWLDEALPLADQLQDRVALWHTHAERQILAVEEGDAVGLWESDAIARAAVAGIPIASPHWVLVFFEAWKAVLRGDLVEAERLAQAALEIGLASDQPDALTIYGAQLVNIRSHQGRFDEVVPLIEQALIDTPGLEVYRAVLASGYVASGDARRAAVLLSEAVADNFPMPMDISWLSSMISWAEVAIRVGDRVGASALHDLLVPYHAQIEATGASVNSPIARYLGRLDRLLGRYDDAEHWLTEAEQISERMESPLMIAYANVNWAELLADRNEGADHEQARARAEAALTAATVGGYGEIGADARAVLDRLG